MRMIVGTITAVEHRGWLRIATTANTGESLYLWIRMPMQRGSFWQS